MVEDCSWSFPAQVQWSSAPLVSTHMIAQPRWAPSALRRPPSALRPYRIYSPFVSWEMVDGLNGSQDGDLSLRRQKARFDGVGRKLAKLLLRELKLALRKPVFARQIAGEERGIVRIQSNHEAGVEAAAYRMVQKRGAGTRPHIGGDADLDGHLALGEDLHQFGIVLGREAVADALCADVQRAPDALRAHGLARMRGQAQAGVTGFGIKLAEGLRASAALIATNADADDGGMPPAHLGGLTEDARCLFHTEVPHGI